MDMEDNQEQKKNNIFILIIPLLCLVIPLIITNNLYKPFEVPSSSMSPTIIPGDLIIVNLLDEEINNGDIVVFKDPLNSGEFFIKRVIAGEGQIIDFNDGKLFIDEEPIEDDYSIGDNYEIEGGVNITYPYIIPEGKIWVMGDNRENSNDSRYFGSVDKKEVLGKAIARYWPFNKIGALG